MITNIDERMDLVREHDALRGSLKNNLLPRSVALNNLIGSFDPLQVTRFSAEIHAMRQMVNADITAARDRCKEIERLIRGEKAAPKQDFADDAGTPLFFG